MFGPKPMEGPVALGSSCKLLLVAMGEASCKLAEPGRRRTALTSCTSARSFKLRRPVHSRFAFRLKLRKIALNDVPRITESFYSVTKTNYKHDFNLTPHGHKKKNRSPKKMSKKTVPISARRRTCDMNIHESLRPSGGLMGHQGHDIHPWLLGKQLAHDLQLLFTALLIDLLFFHFPKGKLTGVV